MNVEDYIILLIRAVVREEAPPEKPEELSFDDILKLARKHKVENICYAAITQLQTHPEENSLKKWKYNISLNQAQTIVQEEEKKRLAQAMTESGIAYLPMKGWYLRSMYPEDEYRFMSDIDILIHRSDRKKACELMHRLGYNGKLGDRGSDDSYKRDPYLHVELHLDMVNIGFEDWFDYYRNIWEKLHVKRGCEYQMEWSDYYIYMVVNFVKDYANKGTGIRSVLDFQVFWEKHGKDLDVQYINDELEKLGLKEIEKETVSLAKKWFGVAEKVLPNTKMSTKVIQDGIYGTSRAKVVSLYNRTNYSIKVRSVRKAVFLFRRAFPRFKRMCYKYPVLKKIPFLLPVFWVVRWMKHSKTIFLEIDTLKDL